MNACLQQPFTKVEVEAALSHMGPLKSPRPDGFSAGFYQRHWSIVENEVTEAISNILNNEGILYSINSTFLALIPKKGNASMVSDFRPISLCNVLYKLISKTITNCLKPLMDSIISENQNAFVLGLLISDNILIAHELLHSLKNNKKGKIGNMVVKLDIFKAYESTRITPWCLH